jgi:hypothetical protein
VAIQVPKFSIPNGYRPQAEDTSLEADLLDFYLLRQRTPTERLSMAAALMQSARKLSLHCLRRQFADLSPAALARKLAEAWLQEDCPPHYIPTGSEMTWIQDSTELAAQLHNVFTAVEVPYYVTGGVAAITYGEPRTTRDLDVVISVPRDALAPLVTALEAAGFYVPGVEDAATGRMRTLQVTQIATISRADLVLADDNDYEQLKFQRRRRIPLPNGTEVYLVSPEDIVVNKLRWGQPSQSEKQWRDVLGVLKTQQEHLDYEYMHHWATAFDLGSVLEQATLEAGVRAISDQQWATAMYPTITRAFAVAQERGRTTQPSPDIEVAEGNRYVLTQDSSAQTFTVVAKLDDREIARYDFAGTVLSTSPSLQNRREWQIIAQRLTDIHLS